jgi:hypothetical protein
MLRKELYPGDVFYYTNGTGYVSNKTFSVDFVAPGSPTPSQGVSDDSNCIPNCPVVVVWKNVATNQRPTKSEGPKHYTTQTPEPIDAIAGWGLSYNLGNVVKYVARAGKKDGVPATADLQKAIRYLARELNALAGTKSWEYAVK